jgi:TonB-linked SusC/RagA family outer membrane protein
MRIILKSVTILIFLLGLNYSSYGQNLYISGISENDGSLSIDSIKSDGVSLDLEKAYGEGLGSILPYSNKVGKLLRSKLRQFKNVKIDSSKIGNTSYTNGEPTELNLGHGQTIKIQGLTSAIAVIDAKELEKTSVLYPGNALFGSATGLWVMQNTGPPNSRAPTLYVRGLSTLGSGKMLVLVDGFERPLNTLSIDYIKSIKILKDAAAKAIYGQRGANGVILVNTKSGGNHKIRYNFNFERGLTQPTRIPQFVNAHKYAKAVNEALFNDGLSLRYSLNEIQYYKTGELPVLYPNVNWVNEMVGNYGAATNFDFNSSGGSERASFYVNLSYRDVKGFYKHTKTLSGLSSQPHMNQLNIVSKGSLDVTSTTKAKLNFNFMLRNYQHPVRSAMMGRIYNIPSNAFPIKNKDGTWGGGNVYGGNPVAQIKAMGVNLNNSRYVSFIGQIKQKLIRDLSATIKVGYYSAVNTQENKTRQFIYQKVSPVLGTKGNIIGSSRTFFGKETPLAPHRAIGNLHVNSNTVEGRINYNKSFGINNLKAFIFFRQHQRVTGIQNDIFRWQNLAGNIHYGLNDTYFTNISLSYAGSNRIEVPKNRWGLFPAFSAAWLISNESFLRSNRIINKLKIKASWGKTGNGYIPISNLFDPKYAGVGSYNFGDKALEFRGVQQTQLGGTEKTFESSYETNVGIKTILFNKLLLSGNVFHEKRKDILVNSGGITSNILGIRSGLRTDGVVKNKGYEIEIGWKDHIGILNYSLMGRMSMAVNKIINNDEKFFPYPYLGTEGRPIKEIYGLVSKGLFQDKYDIAKSPVQNFGKVQAGDVKYVDQNGDEIINRFDVVPLGTRFPQKYYSLILNLGYKRFKLSVTAQAVSDRTIMLKEKNVFWPLIGGQGNLSTWYSNYWTITNKIGAKLPRLTTKNNKNNFRNSTIWLRSGNFLKIRYARLSYTFPDRLISKAHINRAALYISGRNLYTFSNLKYTDPENANAPFPSIRSFVLGFKVQF